MAMSHFPSLVAITHVRTTSTAPAKGASYPYTIIADRMFSSLGVSKISKRKHGSLSPQLPHISTTTLALASELVEPSPGTPHPRRIVRRKLGVAVSGGARAMSDTHTPQPADDDADLDASATADSDDESTLVGADHSTHTEADPPWPKAPAGLPQRSACQPPWMVSRKILEHIADFTSDEEDAEPEPDPVRNAADDEEDGGVETAAVKKGSHCVSPVPWGLRHTPYEPDYEITIEPRTLVYHTHLCPPPWHRQRRMQDDIASRSS